MSSSFSSSPTDPEEEEEEEEEDDADAPEVLSKRPSDLRIAPSPVAVSSRDVDREISATVTLLGAVAPSVRSDRMVLRDGREDRERRQVREEREEFSRRVRPERREKGRRKRGRGQRYRRREQKTAAQTGGYFRHRRGVDYWIQSLGRSLSEEFTRIRGHNDMHRLQKLPAGRVWRYGGRRIERKWVRGE